MCTKPTIGDIVYFNKNFLDRYIVINVVDLEKDHTLIHVVSIDNKDGYNGWFNSNKVSLSIRYNVKKNPTRLNFKLSESYKEYSCLDDDIIPKIRSSYFASLHKEIDSKIREELYNGNF